MLSKVHDVRLKNLRGLFANHNIDGYIFSTVDEHNSEHTTAYDNRVTYMSNFSGSNGICVVTKEKAFFFTDQRYILQIAKELDKSWETGLTSFLSEKLKTCLKDGTVIGFDPMLISEKFHEKLSDKIKLKPITPNLVDIIWNNEVSQGLSTRPACTKDKSIVLFPEIYAGESAVDKINHLRCEMKNFSVATKDGSKTVTYTVLTALDDIAWLLNLRGSDMEYEPLFKSFCLVGFSCVRLYIHLNGLTDEVVKSLSSFVEFRPYFDIFKDLTELATKDEYFLCDPNSCYGFHLALDKHVVFKQIPSTLKKAIKNPTEQKNFRQGHIRDSVAMMRFFSWLEDLMNDKAYEQNRMTEYEVGQKIGFFRSQMAHYVCPSFGHIVGSGANGAIIHYLPTKEKTDFVQLNQPLLIDTGAQYDDGTTTDLTRTVFFGNLEKCIGQENVALFRRMYTIVLISHFVLAERGIDWKKSREPGFVLDAACRNIIFFGHGTGHGVGCYLNVHEGPQKCSMMGREDRETLEQAIGEKIDLEKFEQLKVAHPETKALVERIFDESKESDVRTGMTLTIEPGYYQENCFGIRLENVVLVLPRNQGENRNGMTFVSFVPFQKDLVDLNLFYTNEFKEYRYVITALNEYHATCRSVALAELSDSVEDARVKEWVIKQTEPIRID